MLPFTPHNPESLHNFWVGGGGVFFDKHRVVWGCGTYVCHIMHWNSSFRILRMLNLRLNAKSSVEESTVDTCKVCDMMTFLSDVLRIEMKFKNEAAKRFIICD